MWKKSPPLYLQSPSKIWGPVKPPLFENLVGGSHSPPPPFAESGGGGVHTMFQPCMEWIAIKKKYVYTYTISFYAFGSMFVLWCLLLFHSWQRGPNPPPPPPLFYEDLSFITYPHFSVSFAMKYKLIFYYK